MKSILTGLALAGFAALTTPALALDLNAMSAAERAAFGAEVRTYLMENPEVILQAVEQLETRQAAQQVVQDSVLIQDNADAIFNDGISWEGGNPEGDITLVEFMDYRCGYCRRAYDDVEELISKDGNIRFIVKEFPILGEASLLSSQFAIAAKNIGGSEAYKAAHDALITFNGDLTSVALKRLAKTLGLDGNAVLESMDSAAVSQEIQANRQLAQRMQISGTPTFVMQDQMLRGYLPLEAMTAMVNDIRNN